MDHTMSTAISNKKRIEETKKRLDRVAWALDSVIPLPGGFKLGLDGLVGLVPVVGDGATALLSSYVIGEGVRIGAPKTVMAYYKNIWMTQETSPNQAGCGWSVSLLQSLPLSLARCGVFLVESPG